MAKTLKQKLIANNQMIDMKKCKYCKSTENLTLDHKIPKCQGGKDEKKNIQCLCKDCNQFKSGMSDRQVKNIWRWFLKIQEDRQRRGAKLYKLNNEKNLY